MIGWYFHIVELGANPKIAYGGIAREPVGDRHVLCELLTRDGQPRGAWAILSLDTLHFPRVIFYPDRATFDAAVAAENSAAVTARRRL